MTVMNESIDPSDLEALELYLDGELDDAAIARVEARVEAEPSLRATLARLRRQRATRLEAMSTAFDTDAQSVERLVGSVRDEQAREVADRQRRLLAWWRPSPAYLAAAASLAFGLILGVQLQRQHNSLGGEVATPAIIGNAGGVESSAVTFGNGVNTSGHGAYVVTLFGPDGRERVRVRFHSAEQAQQFVRDVNAGDGKVPTIGDARIGDASY